MVRTWAGSEALAGRDEGCPGRPLEGSERASARAGIGWAVYWEERPANAVQAVCNGDRKSTSRPCKPACRLLSNYSLLAQTTAFPCNCLLLFAMTCQWPTQ